MYIVRYAQAGRRHWRIVVVSMILWVLLLSVVAFCDHPLYQADLRLLASIGAPTLPEGAVVADTEADRQLVESRVRAYTQTATSRAVLQAVVTKLHLGDKPDELAGNVSASTPLDTTFIDVSVLDPDPRRAVLLDDAIGAELIRIAETRVATARVTPLTISVDRPASVSTDPVPRFWLTYLGGGLLGGLSMGIGFATLSALLAARGETVRGWLARNRAATRALVAAYSKRLSTLFWGPGWL
jgi:capsular polysaccharide biosynthesis protein